MTHDELREMVERAQYAEDLAPLFRLAPKLADLWEADREYWDFPSQPACERVLKALTALEEHDG